MNTIIRGLSTRVAKMADKVEWDKTRKTFVLNLPNKGIFHLIIYIICYNILSTKSVPAAKSSKEN